MPRTFAFRLALTSLALASIAASSHGARAQPAPDRDGDGYDDESDRCPDEPEDDDAFEREGCPDDDDDRDGVPDVIDSCGQSAETKNGFEDDDGCPDAIPAGGIPNDRGCSEARACKTAGDDAWKAGDQVTAATRYRRACGLGELAACTSFAMLLASGRGVPVAFVPGAMGLYRIACAGGIPDACRELATLVSSANVAFANPGYAQRLFARACDLGDAKGCERTGRAAPRSGTPAPAPAPSPAPAPGTTAPCSDARTCEASAVAAFIAKRYDEAMRAGRDACERGSATGCSVVGNLYIEGRGVARDPAQGLVFARKACAAGEQSGCHNVAQVLAKGEVVAQDLVLARSLFDTACKKGLAPSCTMLAQLDQPAPPPPAKQPQQPASDPVAATRAAIDAQDYRRAAELGKPLCDGGDMRACALLGVARWQLGKRKEALALYQRACDGAVGWACADLASIHYAGDGVPVDAVKALAFAKRGCGHGDALSCDQAGGWSWALNEEGVPWYERACALGDMEGCGAAAHSYRAGDFGPRDAAKAAYFAKAACALGQWRECALYGLAACDGVGIARDAAVCRQHLALACDRGDTIACDDLRRRFP